MAIQPTTVASAAPSESGGGPRFLRRAADLARLVRSGHGGSVVRAVTRRLASRSRALGLRRDLRLLHPAPPAKIDLVVRPLAADDDLSFLDPHTDGLDSGAAYDRMVQRRFVADGFSTCYVAVAPDGKICFMQWLLASRDNERIQSRWPGLFPLLAPDEALLEGAYTVETSRGKGVMAHGMARVAEHAVELGARWVITFVGEDNIASLKGCRKAGFVPWVERRESWRLFRRRVRFTPLPEGTPYPFEAAGAGGAPPNASS
ncbi:MAG TPA: GNAT family N-acetyltransferase [Gemmatimonadales bacterium]|nr:GNAT family N-acetyltransferase [Gemmatimonadales bacterium]